MPALTITFQLHQPYRLKAFPFDRIGHDHTWEDGAQNSTLLNLACDYSYLPANEALLRAIRNTEGQFRLAFSISGTCLEQLYRYRPDVIESFRKLSDTGCVEFLAQPYYHSLAGLYSLAEFRRQVVKHEKAIQHLLEQKPTVFCNTGLLYSDELLPAIEELGYKTIMTGDNTANPGSPDTDQVFHAGRNGIQILPRNAHLSKAMVNDIKLNKNENPNAANVFLRKITALADSATCINISFDYESLERIVTDNDSAFLYLEQFPTELKKHENYSFLLPSDASQTAGPKQPSYNSPEWTSRIGETKDAAAWNKNQMQRDALKELYACESAVLKCGRPELMDQWGRLQTSDHFRYMGTQSTGDPTDHDLNPYSSHYDAYLNYMNVLSNFRKLLEKV